MSALILFLGNRTYLANYVRFGLFNRPVIGIRIPDSIAADPHAIDATDTRGSAATPDALSRSEVVKREP